MNRRTFLSLGATSALGLLQATRFPRRLSAQQKVPYGESRLGLSDNFRDGSLYIPQSYTPDVPMPLVMMLHGYSGAAQSVRSTFTLAEELGVVVIAPESRDVTWGQSIPGFDADVKYLGAAFRYVEAGLNLDLSRIALGGVSDGAGYALSMGLAYGDTFNHIMVFSGGIMIPVRRQGKPRIFMAHGLNDQQMPIDRTARRFVPKLKEEGYDLTYKEYEGGHGTPPYVMREAFEWFTHSGK